MRKQATDNRKTNGAAVKPGTADGRRMGIIAMDYLDRVEHIVETAKNKVCKVIDVAMVYTYYEVGRVIVEEEQKGAGRAAYGRRILANVSERLTSRFGKGWGTENLRLMRKLYLVYSQEIQNGVLENGGKSKIQNRVLEIGKSVYPFRLSWSHYLKLMRIENREERRFYEIEAIEGGWSLAELKRQFKSSLYERLALSRDKAGIKKLSARGHVVERPEDAIKDPYVLEFLGLEEKERYSESELENRIIEHIEQFLLELGKGFIRVGRQVRFTFQERHFKVDLVFYNRILRCFVVIDLKTGELSHEDIGQMMMYVNYYDRKIKLKEENPTIGILLCADKDDAIVEMTLPRGRKRIFASKYLTVLPDKETLRQLVRKQMPDNKECGND